MKELTRGRDIEKETNGIYRRETVMAEYIKYRCEGINWRYVFQVE